MSQKSRENHHIKEEYFDTLRNTANVVDPYVRNYIETKFDNADIIKEVLLNRYRFGKPQLRPAQVRLAYELVGGDNRENAIPACAAVELKDTGYYCYDDFIDLHKHDIRLTLIGGAFIGMSYLVAQELSANFSKSQIQQTLEELLNLDSNNLEGTFIDQKLKETLDQELYMEKAKKYNFQSHAFKIGGILGGGNKHDIELLENIGKNIGCGYIIANDTWDFGKELEDFRSHKYTLPIIYAFEHTTSGDNKTLHSLFGKKNLSSTEKELIKRIFVSSNAIQFGKDIAKKYCDQGLEYLYKFPDSHARKMIEFSTTMTQKNKYFNSLNT